MRKVPIGKALVSGLTIGGNPFSGFSHQGKERTEEMLAYFTPEQIKSTLRACEEAGVNTFCGRTDDHIFGILREYWADGGKIQWIAQICTERGKPDVWRDWLKGAAELGAVGAYLHGGVVDMWHANEEYDNFGEALGMMRDLGVAAGFAGHNPDAHAWIRDNLDVDFQMCSYYNPTDRSKSAHHQDTGEKWHEDDRERMIDVISKMKTPAIHYKIFAAGNKPIIEGFERMGKGMRDIDACCVGMYTGDDPDMITKNVALFEKYCDGEG